MNLKYAFKIWENFCHTLKFFKFQMSLLYPSRTWGWWPKCKDTLSNHVVRTSQKTVSSWLSCLLVNITAKGGTEVAFPWEVEIFKKARNQPNQKPYAVSKIKAGNITLSCYDEINAKQKQKTNQKTPQTSKHSKQTVTSPFW